MPKAEVQKAPPRPKPKPKTAPKATTKAQTQTSGASVLDRIIDVADLESGVKLLTYGRAKTGKTRLICDFPKPLLLIGTEEGTKSVKNVPDVKYIRIYSSDDLEQLVEHVKSSGEYKSVGLDTAGGYQDIVIKEVLGLDNVVVQRTYGMMQQQDWGMVSMQFKERLHKLIGLADRVGINVGIIAHERNFSEDRAESDVMVPAVGAALTPSLSNWIATACDYICQCYIREETITKKVPVGKSFQNIVQKTGKREFCLRIGPHPIFQTGFRLPVGFDLPELIVNPTYGKIASLIQGKV